MATISTDQRLIDHVLPQSFSDEYRAENAQALRDWPSKAGDDA